MRHLIEQRLRALAAHDAIGDRIGMLLVRIARAANTAGEAHAATLLNDVCSLVSCEM